MPQVRIVPQADFPICLGCGQRLALAVDVEPATVAGTPLQSDLALDVICERGCPREKVDEAVRAWGAAGA